jgi:hypothetical protein
MSHGKRVCALVLCTGISVGYAISAGGLAAAEGELYVGWAAADITPPKPVALVGQLQKRLSQSVHDPLTATALALETRGADGAKEQAIMISCDLVGICKATQDRVQESVKKKLADFDSRKLFLNGTHTHTAPGQADSTFGALYDVSKDPGAMGASEYADFLVPRLADAAARAWQGRQRGGMSWALGQAVVGHNRRATYFDGKAAMYGDTRGENFDSIEGYEDHGVEMLLFWDEKRELTGMVLNVTCPSQETENAMYVSADFWHEVRQELKKRYSDKLFVLAQCGPSGDQSPHLLVRQRAEELMLKRKGISRRQEIALRVARAVDEVMPYAKQDIQTRPVFKHAVPAISLPTKQPPAKMFYEVDSVQPMEFHVLRLGDVALATNPFEMYLDYGVRMKTRSKAVLTMVVNISGAMCGYLPTAKAARGGGYSADNYLVGPEGGQVLVNETVKQINQMFQ